MGGRAEREEDFGKPLEFDPSFNGPLKHRSCTDIICLLIFFVFIVVWIVLGIVAIKNGDPNLLLVPRDSKGRRCGLDSDVKDKPYLFFYDLTKCLSPEVPFTGCKTPQVCVPQCPTQMYVNDTEHQINDDYCVNKTSNDCPSWYLPSESVQNRCFPIKFDELKEIQAFTHNDVTYDKLVKAIKNVKLFSDVEQIGQVIVKDVINSWWKILIGVGVAVFVCILYIFMLRFIAGIMVWISILGVIALLSGGIYFTQMEYRNISSEETEKRTKKNLWLAGLIILSAILGIILLVIIFLRKRILLAIALIKEGSKAVGSVTSVLFFPLVPWVLQIGVIAYALVVCLYLATTGKAIYRYKDCNEKDFFNNTICNPNIETLTSCTCRFIGTEETWYYKYAQAFNFIGFLWLAFFVSALGQMILAGVFAQWYWTLKKSTLPFFAVSEATLRTFRYHIGTLAFGSLIITICRLIRIALEYIDHKLKKYDNPITRAIMCCLKCFFWCLERFLKFINKNAYIMCAIHGKNFCASAKDAFMLLMRNIVRVFVLDKVTDFLFFLSKLLITIGVGSLAYVCFATDLTTIDNSNINYELVPVCIVMAITYLISTIFFNVYSMAVDTLFLCFLEDCERNDGSNEKPYYMSKNLMKIFGKKNKLS